MHLSANGIAFAEGLGTPSPPSLPARADQFQCKSDRRAPNASTASRSRRIPFLVPTLRVRIAAPRWCHAGREVPPILFIDSVETDMELRTE
jgi:hypothetical protein